MRDLNLFLSWKQIIQVSNFAFQSNIKVFCYALFDGSKQNNKNLQGHGLLPFICEKYK